MATQLEIRNFTYTNFTNSDTAYLKDAASKIKAAGQLTIKNYFGMGRALIRARGKFDQNSGRDKSGRQGGWSRWLDSEVGVSISHAGTIMLVTKKFATGNPAAELPNLSVLEKIVRTDTPDEVVTHVLANPNTSISETAKLKKDITAQKGHAADHDTPLPSANEAREIARDTGTPTVAGDGKIYFGAIEAQAEAEDKRRTQVYGGIDAIHKIANMKQSPGEWLKDAHDWQLRDFDRNDELAKAISWLERLNLVWVPQNGK